MSMDNRTLKSTIVELRDGSQKMSFQEIANLLAEKHGVIRTRQAVQSMYTRSKKENKESRKRMLIATDVVNMYSIGYSGKSILDVFKDRKQDITYDDILTIIKEEQEFISDVRENNIKKVEEALKHNNISIESVYENLKYGEIVPTQRALKWYIAQAYSNIIYRSVRASLRRVYQHTNDKEIVKESIKKLTEQVEKTSIAGLDK